MWIRNQTHQKGGGLLLFLYVRFLAASASKLMEALFAVNHRNCWIFFSFSFFGGGGGGRGVYSASYHQFKICSACCLDSVLALWCIAVLI